MNFKDLTGKEFNYLKVIKISNKKTRNGCYWDCECICGNIVTRRGDFLKTKAVSCGCMHPNKFNKGQSSHRWNGVGDLGLWYYNKLKYAAEHERDLSFDITIEYIWKLFNDQKGRCKLTNLPIKLGITQRAEMTASLDRIDSTKGYIEGNLQWVHKDIQKMKMDLSLDKFIYYSNLIACENPIIWE